MLANEIVKQMKFGFIAHKVHRHGGMERAAAEVLERVAKKHDVVVIARECEIQEPRLTWVPVQTRMRPSLLLSWHFAQKARQIEKRLGCAVTNSIGAAAIDADVITAQFCHAAFQARFGNLRAGQGRLRRWYHSYAGQIFVSQERFAYSSSRLKKVIAVSEGVKQEIISYYGVDSRKIDVIPNAVDHSVFKPAGSDSIKRDIRLSLGLPENAFLCLFLGGDWERKGLADAIRAIAGVPESVLVVVGHGDKTRFHEVARRAGVEGRVVFAGTSQRPQDYYAAADVFVFPSRYEAFSLASIEAAAAGLPIIALKINGTEELIEDGVNGFFVEGSPESIHQKLQILTQNGVRLQAMSSASLEASWRYTWDRVAADQLRVFEAAQP